MLKVSSNADTVAQPSVAEQADGGPLDKLVFGGRGPFTPKFYALPPVLH